MRYNIIILLLLVFNCQKKVYTCGLIDNRQVKYIDSEILEYKMMGAADTIVANLSGKVYDKLVYNKIDNMPSELPYSNVWAKDIYTNSVLGICANEKGEYRLILPASTYDIEVQFVGYNNLKVENLKINSGEIIKFSCLLGTGDKVTSYKLDKLNKPIKLDKG